ncbi:MAG: hypothetical protein RLZZ111_1994 [Planctomycetota bacterium]|jgi:hypothetical protein
MTCPRGNPFSTRHTRPGLLAPLDASGHPLDVGDLVGRVLAMRGAAIVGPHGSGKSNLLHHLAAAIDAGGGRVARVRLQSRHDSLRALSAVGLAGSGGTVCIDSWERAGLVERLVLVVTARAVGARLLVTAHRPVAWLATLVRCETTPRLLEALVSRLVGPPRRGATVDAADVEAAFAAHGGDVREALYALYDRVESRRTAAGGLPSRHGGDGRDDRGGTGPGIHESTARFSYVGAPERNLG